MVFPHRVEDEEVATEAVDSGTLLAENAALREQLIRALGEAENGSVSGEIEALGGRPRHPAHEAVMQAYEPGIPAGTIVRVLQDGYTIHERLLRPARVVVSAGAQFPQVRAFD